MKKFKHNQNISLVQAAEIIQKIGASVSASTNGGFPESYSANEAALYLKENKGGWKSVFIAQNYGGGAVILLKEGGDVGHLHLAKDFIAENNRYILKI